MAAVAHSQVLVAIVLLLRVLSVVLLHLLANTTTTTSPIGSILVVHLASV